MANNDFDLPRPTNPVPSSSSIVANDNSKVLDYLVNGTGTVVTRTGKPLTTFNDIIDTYGFGLADFTFAEGGVLSNKNLLVLGGSVYYKYIGSGGLPLTINAGTNPVGNSDWLATAANNAEVINSSKVTVSCIKNLSIPLVSGQSFSVTGFYSGTTVGGGDFIYDASKDKAEHNGGTIIAPEAIAAWDGSRFNLDTLTSWTGTGSGCWVRFGVGLDRKAEWFGIKGDYDATLNPSVNDTKQLQALFDSVDDNCSVYGYGDMRLVRDGATVANIEGVMSYLCTIKEKNNITIKSGFKSHQKHNSTLDCVGFGFYKCAGLNLEMPEFDGGFRYSSGDSISFKQQLLHLISCNSTSGGFSVKNSSNIGFLISNQYGVGGSGFINSAANNSNLHTIISENCLQNTTFGTGVSRYSIGNMIILNPILSGLKLSSRVDASAPDSAFKGLFISSIQLSFDETYVIPNNSNGVGLNGTVAALDYVSCAGDVSIGSIVADFEWAGLTSIAVKQVPQGLGDLTRRNGSFHIGHLKVKNQTVVNSSVLEIDNESTGSSFDFIECENISKLIQISNIETVPAQQKSNKWLKIGTVIAKTLNRVGISAVSYDADFIEIGTLILPYDSGYTLQAVRIDSTCNINRIRIGNIQTNSTVAVLGVVNNSISIGGHINTSLQPNDPLSINLTSLSTSRFDIGGLRITGDGSTGRKCLINNVGIVTNSGGFDLEGCPNGVSVTNFSSFKTGDNANSYAGLVVLQPWQFGGTIGTIQGSFAYSGSPINTLTADIGCTYRRTDNGQFIVKTSGIGTQLGWVALS